MVMSDNFLSQNGPRVRRVTDLIFSAGPGNFSRKECIHNYEVKRKGGQGRLAYFKKQNNKSAYWLLVIGY